MYMSNTDKSLLDVTVLVWITLEEKKTLKIQTNFTLQLV